MKLKIKVTKEIIAKSMMCGTLQNNIAPGFSCAIALAVIDIFPKAAVSMYNIYPDYQINPDTELNIELPGEAIRFIYKFDSLKDTPHERLLLDPIEFTVNLTDEIVDSINIDEVKTILERSETLELMEV